MDPNRFTCLVCGVLGNLKSILTSTAFTKHLHLPMPRKYRCITQAPSFNNGDSLYCLIERLRVTAPSDEISIKASAGGPRGHWLNRLRKKVAWLVISSEARKPSLAKTQGDETGGNHAFRRFRNTLLRKSHVPDDLTQFWLGHAGKSMTDEYSQIRDDVKCKMVAEQVD